MATEERVGARLARLRKVRGLTQVQFAAAVHYSVSLVKQVERGVVAPSAPFVAAAASALGVHPNTLFGTDEPLVDEPDYGQLMVLRAAVDAWDDPRPEGEPITLDLVDRRLDAINRTLERAAGTATGSTAYATAAVDLAALLHHLYVMAEATGAAGARAQAALHDAYRLTATVAGRFRQADLAAVASERHIALAQAMGDPIRQAISAFHRSSIHLRAGRYADGLRLLERARRDLDGRSAVSTQLHLRSAVLAARSGDLALADEHVAEARSCGTSSSEYRGIDPSELNVAVHWCAVPVEAADGAEALRRGSEVRLANQSRPERLGHHHIDQARAWLLHGDRERCVAELNTARRVAPFSTRHHPSVRETVLAIATADRRTTDSLADFARWAGIQF
nr:helix-turn-helix transcriptional regulator [Labedaea rhizosphaerae]